MSTATTENQIDPTSTTSPPKKQRQGARSDSARKPPMPVFRGLASGEERKIKLSGATMSLIESKTSSHQAAPSDAIFVATVAAMGRKKHQRPAVSQSLEVDVQLPPAVWEFLDAQATDTGADHDVLIRSYLGLI